MKGGSVCEAMEDFTGGLTELIDPRNPPKNLWRTMMKSLKKGALMGCAIEVCDFFLKLYVHINIVTAFLVKT